MADARRPDPRWLVLAAAVGLAGPWGPAGWAAAVLPSLSPLAAFASALASRAPGWIALFGLPALALALRWPRGICRYACPAGLLQDLAGGGRAAPRCWPPRLGAWIGWLILGGAAAGYPLLLWLDPMAIVNAGLRAAAPPMDAARLAAGLGLPLLLLLAFLWPGAWCARLCPLGGLQDSLAAARQAGAGIHHHGNRIIPEVGTAVPAVRATAGGTETRRSPPLAPLFSRRAFLGACAGAAAAGAVRAAGGRVPAPLRPPGAAPENRFSGLCLRCGNCAAVCPARIIRPDCGAHGAGAFLTPVLHFDANYCSETCRRCTQVCPSGALAKLPLADKRRWPIGLAGVDLETCAMAAGQECKACVEACPFEAVGIADAPGGFGSQPQVVPGKCTGCGACEAVCPVQPIRAIRVVAHDPRPQVE